MSWYMPDVSYFATPVRGSPLELVALVVVLLGHGGFVRQPSHAICCAPLRARGLAGCSTCPNDSSAMHVAAAAATIPLRCAC